MNETQNKNALNGMLIPLLTAVIAPLLAAVTGYFYLFHTDVTKVDGVYQTMLFKNDGSSTLLLLFVTALCSLPLLLCFFKKEWTAPRGVSDGLPMVFARCTAGVTAAATFIMYFLLSPAGTPYDKTDANSAIVTALLVLALPCALYFLLPALFGVKNRTVLFFLGLCALLFASCELLLTHYFMMDFLSSPTRVFAVFGYALLILFLLLDLKKLAYPESGGRSRAVVALLCFLLNTADALPRLVLSFAEKEPFAVTLFTFHTLLRLALGIYALLSILPFFLSQKAAEERADTLANEEETPTEALAESESDPQADPQADHEAEEPEALKEPEEASGEAFTQEPKDAKAPVIDDLPLADENTQEIAENQGEL